MAKAAEDWVGCRPEILVDAFDGVFRFLSVQVLLATVLYFDADGIRGLALEQRTILLFAQEGLDCH